MKTNRPLICCVLALTFSCVLLTGCYNNLVNRWDNYTGDTYAYYNSTAPDSVAADPPSVDTGETDGELDKYGIPQYWSDELTSAVNQTLQVIDGAEKDYSAFLWYNDAHLSYSARRSVSVLKYLQDHTNVRFVNFGGDVVSDNDEVEHSEIISQLYDWREKTLALANHHSVPGNHDDDIDEFANRSDLYDFLLKEEAGKITDSNNSFCYHVDNTTEKTRYIYLSTGFDITTADDINFLTKALNDTPKDWHIVVISHIWFVYNDTLTPTEGKVPEFSQVILNVLDDYNARMSGNEKGVDYDFAKAQAKVEFCIGGHTHVDFEFYTEGGIPVILNETDSYHLRGGNKGLDKTDEASVSVVVADYDKETIHIIRAGRGESRTVSLSGEN